MKRTILTLILATLTVALGAQTPTLNDLYVLLQQRVRPGDIVPTPTPAAVNVSTSPTLTCTSTLASSFELLFGTTNPPNVSTPLSACKWAPPMPLAPGTKYFWRVIAHDKYSSTTSPVWSFTTAAAIPPPPVTGQTITLAAGGDFQAALNAAKDGDTIALAPGAMYTGNFVVPAKTGSAYLTVTSSGSIPAVSSPVASTLPAATLPKVKAPAGGGAAFALAPGAAHVQVVGVEFQGNPGAFGDVIQLGSGGCDQNTLTGIPTDIVLDRVYVHGDPVIGQKRGVALNSANTKIINSYFSDIRIQGQDSQAIGGWNGPGPYLIENNHVEAASEPIMFGGGDPCVPNLVPSDIVLRGNYITKPPAWKGQTGWNIKNLLEFKNARRVLVENNVLDYSWADAQVGYGIVITIRNQDGACTWCVVSDLEGRYNVIRHADAAAFSMLGKDTGYPSAQGTTVNLHDNLGIDTGWAFAIENGFLPTALNHNTFSTAKGRMISIIGSQIPAGQFTSQNNIFAEGTYGITGDGTVAMGAASLFATAPMAAYDHNVIERGDYPIAFTYPAGNTILAPGQLAPRLGTTFVYSGPETSSDGKPMGADVAAIKARIPWLVLP